MDGLPDELMLMILGHVDEADTLLDAVPLVCKRWLELSRDPRAWAAVSVVECGTLEKARAVLRAPHLRRLKISFLSEEGYQPTNHSRMRSALRRSRFTVRELLVSGDVHHPTLLALLWRSKKQLRELSMDLCYYNGPLSITTVSTAYRASSQQTMLKLSK
jgi:hypothetical protein